VTLLANNRTWRHIAASWLLSSYLPGRMSAWPQARVIVDVARLSWKCILSDPGLYGLVAPFGGCDPPLQNFWDRPSIVFVFVNENIIHSLTNCLFLNTNNTGSVHYSLAFDSTWTTSKSTKINTVMFTYDNFNIIMYTVQSILRVRTWCFKNCHITIVPAHV